MFEDTMRYIFDKPGHVEKETKQSLLVALALASVLLMFSMNAITAFVIWYGVQFVYVRFLFSITRLLSIGVLDYY